MIRLPLFAVSVVVSLGLATTASAQVTVSYLDGRLSLQCSGAALSEVFEQIEAQTGVTLTIEDGVKSKRLSASFVDEPLQRGIQRLLDGEGVNYIVIMDPRNWERVDKVFVGAGGGGSSSPAGGGSRYSAPPPPVADDGYGDDEFENADEMDNFNEDFNDEFADEFGDEGINGDEPPMDEFAPPAGDPNGQGFNYFPQNNFQRSNITPGQPSNPPFSAPATPTNPAQPQANPFGNPGTGAPPPATFPFTDPYGRPVPVPPGTQPNQQNPPQ